jgi:hypothetical protein
MIDMFCKSYKSMDVLKFDTGLSGQMGFFSITFLLFRLHSLLPPATLNSSRTGR